VRSSIVDREQVLTRWQESIDEHKELVQQAYERVQRLCPADRGQPPRRHRDAGIQGPDPARTGQVGELQRLAEERIRREMDEFREDYEKRGAKPNCVRSISGANKTSTIARWSNAFRRWPMTSN
jgi:hypothetical protein